MIKVANGKLFFSRQDFFYRIEAITDDNELDSLENETGLHISFAVKYMEYGETLYTHIVTKDRKHYEYRKI